MSTPNDGGPAFPVPPERLNAWSSGKCQWTFSQPGMTLRDYFAAAALQGMWACTACSGTHEQIAEGAYAQADSMLAERSKPKEAKS